MSRNFFITSCGTGIGKTLVTATLAYQLAEKGERVAALKPVISGYQKADETNDTAHLLASLALPYDDAHIDSVSPWRFAAPVAPSLAATREARRLSLRELTQFCQLIRLADTVLVEGVGGIMVPLNEKETVLDWMAVLGWPVVMVAGSYLGSLSHTLSACEVLKSRGLALQALIVSEPEQSNVDFMDTCHTLKKFVPYSKHVVALPRLRGAAPLWRDVADITWVLT